MDTQSNKDQWSLVIDDPCPMLWSKMDAVPGGRHCGSCNKVVVDFTQYTQEEIIDYFKKHGQNVCGQYRPDQLAGHQPHSWRYRLAFASLLTLSFFGFKVSPMQAQEVERPLNELNVSRTKGQGSHIKQNSKECEVNLESTSELERASNKEARQIDRDRKKRYRKYRRGIWPFRRNVRGRMRYHKWL